MCGIHTCVLLLDGLAVMLAEILRLDERLAVVLL